MGAENEKNPAGHVETAPGCAGSTAARQELKGREGRSQGWGRAWKPLRHRPFQGNVIKQSLWPIELRGQRQWLAGRPMGEDVGGTRPSSVSRTAGSLAGCRCKPGVGRRGCEFRRPDSRVAVAMFFSQAGARPRRWEASQSEHKKWVEVSARRAVSDLNLTRDFHFRHPAWLSLSFVAQIGAGLSFRSVMVNDRGKGCKASGSLSSVLLPTPSFLRDIVCV